MAAVIRFAVLPSHLHSSTFYNGGTLECSWIYLKRAKALIDCSPFTPQISMSDGRSPGPLGIDTLEQLVVSMLSQSPVTPVRILPVSPSPLLALTAAQENKTPTVIEPEATVPSSLATASVPADAPSQGCYRTASLVNSATLAQTECSEPCR